MIYSMTAFARGQAQGDYGSLTCEMRSINHRYLEISLYLTDMLRTFEMALREHIRQLLKRGKIECVFRYQPTVHSSGALFNVNASLVQELCRAKEKICLYLTDPAPVSPLEILRFPGVLETKENDLVSALQKEVFSLTDVVLRDLLEARKR